MYLHYILLHWTPRTSRKIRIDGASTLERARGSGNAFLSFLGSPSSRHLFNVILNARFDFVEIPIVLFRVPEYSNVLVNSKESVATHHNTDTDKNGHGCSQPTRTQSKATIIDDTHRFRQQTLLSVNSCMYVTYLVKLERFLVE
jgi:hypothetical protein